MNESFDLVWKRIYDNAGSDFLTIQDKPFQYEIEGNYFIPLKPVSNRPKIPKEKVKEAYEMWPVTGPGVYNKAGFMGPSYIWGLFNDNRIINKENN